MELSEDSNDSRRSKKDSRDSRERDADRNRHQSERGRRDERDNNRNRRDDEVDRDRRSDRYRSDRYRQDRRSRRSRSSSRDRRRSRSRSRRRSSSRDRRRSSSRERRRSRTRRSRSPRGRYPRKYGYPSKSNNDRNAASQEDGGSKDRFFMPGITGRFREQIERRKLLWQKKSEPEVAAPVVEAPTLGGPSRATKLWETTTFAQDQDGKVANKFKRLMGIKGQTEAAVAKPTTDVMKKQDEMFRSMEQQYEVARTATHTMRGVGLGFSSSFPR